MEDKKQDLAKLVNKMYSDFSSSENVQYGYQDYRSANISDHIYADDSNAVAFSYSGRKFKLTCGGPHFSDTSESWDFVGLDAYDGKTRLNLEKYVEYFAGYRIHGSIPYPLKVLSMKHLSDKKYEITANIASSRKVYHVNFEKGNVEKIEEKMKGGEE